MKKLLLITILGMIVVGCSAHDIALWKNSDRYAAERGESCYQTASGYYYCKDKYGNRTY